MNRVVLVTGGAQGIGKGIVRHLLLSGDTVVIADIDAEAGRETVEEVASLGAVAFIETDVADEASVRSCLDQAVARWGRLDALVNNAGIAHAHAGPVERLALDLWNRIIATNLTGSFLMAKHAAPHLRKTKGCIVNLASTRAIQSEPHTEAYSASKGGVLALTHALAMSLGPEIRVNCVSPGWIDVRGWRKKSSRVTIPLAPADHEQHPCGRVGTPEDVAALVGYLISETSGFVTGQNFVVDGGMTRKLIYRE